MSIHPARRLPRQWMKSELKQASASYRCISNTCNAKPGKPSKDYNMLNTCCMAWHFSHMPHRFHNSSNAMCKPRLLNEINTCMGPSLSKLMCTNSALTRNATNRMVTHQSCLCDPTLWESNAHMATCHVASNMSVPESAMRTTSNLRTFGALKPSDLTFEIQNLVSHVSFMFPTCLNQAIN